MDEEYHVLSRPQLRQLVLDKYEGDPYLLIEELSFKLARLRTSQRPPALELPQPVTRPAPLTLGVDESHAQATPGEPKRPPNLEMVPLRHSGPRFSLWLFHDTGEHGREDKAPVELSTLKQTTETSIPNYDVDKFGFYLDFEPLKPVAPRMPNPQSPLLSSLKEIHKIHESYESHWNTQWDALVDSIARTHYKDHPSERDLYGRGGVAIPEPYALEFAHLVRQKGIPELLRARLWPHLSGAVDLRVEGEYQQLIRDIESSNDPVLKRNVNDTELDISRTLLGNCHFNDVLTLSPGPNFAKLRRILYAFVAYKPSVGYYQGMNKIVGNLLIYATFSKEWDEEDVFWLFVAICDEILPRYDTKLFFTLLGSIFIDQQIIFDVYLPKYMPELWDHFRTLNVGELVPVVINWWLTLFIGVKFILLDTWFKLMDNLMLAAPSEEANAEEMSALKMLCVSLAMFKCLAPTLLLIEDAGQIYQLLDGNSGESNRHDVSIKYHNLITCYTLFLKKLSAEELRINRRIAQQH